MGTNEKPSSIIDFLPRFEEYERQRNHTHEFIQDLMIYTQQMETALREQNTYLTKRLQEAQLDFEDAAMSRRELQQRLLTAESQTSSVSQVYKDYVLNLPPYIMVLIDGNGLHFKEKYVRLGFEGGKMAARALADAIANECRMAGDVEVKVKVYANVSSVGKAMKRVGLTNNEQDLKQFSHGFNQGKAAFDFIDSGESKDMIDDKIQESTNWHLRNMNCKQVLLGVSHDASYGQFFASLLREDEARSRVTVLEAGPIAPEILSTHVNTIGFESIFRNEPLPERRASSVKPGPSPAPPSPTSSSAVSYTGSTTVGSGTVSYANVTQKASPPPQISLPLPLKNTSNKNAGNANSRTTKPQPPPWNPGPRGLDAPIPLNQTALENIKKRKDNNKLCNNHFLRGPCAKGSECCFEHNYKPNKDELNAIAFLTRLNPCTNGQDCDVENCIYGHHCPSVVHGICTHPFCKFRAEEHPPNTKLQVARR